jgi:predicted DNA-binding protein (MmcQ/YjbR family)
LIFLALFRARGKRRKSISLSFDFKFLSMDIVSLREYCIGKKGATESFPFGDDTLVFKADGKIFALVNLDDELSINLKCDPILAIDLRERYTSVTPGYHMNKKHWNTVLLDGSIPDKEVFSWIDHSYDLIINKK